MNDTRLIASDLDGTMLRHDKTISQRTVAAIHAARQTGVTVIAATGRQAASLAELLAPTGVRYAVASNGAIGVDLDTGRVLFEEYLSAQVAGEIVAFLTDRLENVRFSVIRDQGATRLAEPGYLALVDAAENALGPLAFALDDVAELVSQPTLKLGVRHPTVSPDSMLELLQSSALSGFVATTSGAPFLEVQGEGVTKASGLSQLCAHLGIDSAEVMAIGDAKNDVEMMIWAGCGVAMGNAVPEAIAAATWTTASNEHDGLALAIERQLGLG